MRRFYCPIDVIGKDYINIKDKAEIHHIKDVLRLKVNDRLIVFSDNAIEYKGKISDMSPHCVTVKITDVVSKKPVNLPLITLACAIPKKAKIEYIIEKTTELGINEFIPLKTRRTIVDLKGKEQRRLLRWQRIAKSSAKQCGRVDIPKIYNVFSLKQALSYMQGFDLAIIPNLNGPRKLLANIISKNKFKNVFVFIGPEGDFTKDEVGLARDAGCIPVCLGENILRVDTAAIAVVSLLKLGKKK